VVALYRYITLWLALALACAWYLAGSPLHSTERLPLGGISGVRLAGFSAAETSDEGRGFRWTEGDATVRLAAQGAGAHIVRLTLSAPRPLAAPVPASVTLNDRALAVIDLGQTPRRLQLLAPPDAIRWRDNELGLSSPLFRTPAMERGDDLRAGLGLVVFEAGWRSLAPAHWIVAAQATAIAAAATALAALLRRAAIPPLPTVAALALFLAIQLAMRHSDPRFAQRLSALALSLGLALAALAAALLVRPQPGDTGHLPWRPWLRTHWPAFAGFVALTALMQMPLLPRLATQIPGHPGDAFEYVWKLQIFSDYLLERRQSPAFLPDLLYPEGLELAVSEMTPANTLLGLPLTALFGPVAAFNLLNLLSYLLSACCAYLLAHRLGAPRLAAWVGAIVFAFTLRRFFQMHAGHLPLMPTQYLPLALYGLEGLLTRRRSWDAFVAALGLALAAWASLYYGVALALFMGGYALLQCGLRGLAPWLQTSWRQLVLATVVLLALTAPFAQPYVELRGQGVATTHSLLQLEIHAARPLDYLRPNPYHPLWGDAAQITPAGGGERFVMLGYVPMALMLAGLWAARGRRAVRTLALLSLGAFVLTLGPFLALPGGLRLPMPGLFIYEHVPVLNGIRIWNRFVILIALSAAVLASLALAGLARRPARYYAGAAVAAILLIGELAAVTSFTRAEPRPVDLWLAQQPGRGAVIELPIDGLGEGLSGNSLFHSLAYRKPSNMWYGTFYPPLYVESVEQLQQFPADAARQAMLRLGSEYLIVDVAGMDRRVPGWQETLATWPRLTQVHRWGGYTIYRLGRR
jgi:hypothetical protein